MKMNNYQSLYSNFVENNITKIIGRDELNVKVIPKYFDYLENEHDDVAN